MHDCSCINKDKASLLCSYICLRKTPLFAILLTIAALLIVDGDISLGQYIAFSAIMTNVIAPFKSTASFISKLQSIRTINERVQDINEEARMVSVNQIERLDNENAMIISNILIPEDDTLRITYKDTPINVKFQTKEEVRSFESLIAGDEYIPSNLRIGLPYENKKRQLIIAKSNPYLYRNHYDRTYAFGTRRSSEEYEYFYTISRMVGFSDLELDNKLSLSSLTPQELYFLGIARALWCKPKYIAICEPNENANTTVDDLTAELSLFVLTIK